MSRRTVVKPADSSGHPAVDCRTVISMENCIKTTDMSSQRHTVEEPAPVGQWQRVSVPISRVIAYVSLAVVGGGVDLWTKSVMFAWRGLPGQRSPYWLIDGVFGVETAVNLGAVFGIGAGKGTAFAALSVVAAIGILAWLFYFGAARSWWMTISLGMVSGGIIGNLYDRLGLWWDASMPIEWQSGVRDWILFRIQGVPFFDPWPNFNIADSLLVVGAAMLIWQSFTVDVQSPGQDAGTANAES
ncbi:signal peptidase II [Crateriforma spongiae]|nr:signal peptidase II [Crateriforma spongiae]